tara:strand:- start:560 stop:772 length:213 start_codon:yes stop_codon:yes gene_type:complete
MMLIVFGDGIGFFFDFDVDSVSASRVTGAIPAIAGESGMPLIAFEFLTITASPPRSKLFAASSLTSTSDS